MDKLREEFEEWLEETHGLYGEDVEWQQGRNCYARFGIHLAFQAWRASRASIVVELPEMEDFELLDGYKVRESLRSIGLSIKGE
ncbi:hypothetical protein OHN11_09860 [Serratia marcescens]|uniref:hypothetical protein n=1 Tax=Serratia marcescens TaxID=615 RepID=UPI0005770F3E|nr:hypothetical protein [Serratia marcescens]MDM3533616.1 hypothetical protein [Serratia marcescens]MDM3540251.1 hypothetical protein [Serratia marcescens]